MQAAAAIGSLIELGIDFVPVPGVKPAFDILNFIWQSVQQASNNREVLRNLAVSAADILTAVNHVLEENEPNKHVRDMLRKLETVLTDIGNFAAEHANMNLFKLLIKNVDVDGRIEFFQSRLQNLWVAFNIVALGSIGSEVHLIHQGQPANNPDPTQASSTPLPESRPPRRPQIEGKTKVPPQPQIESKTKVPPRPQVQSGTKVPPQPQVQSGTKVPPHPKVESSKKPQPQSQQPHWQATRDTLVGASSSTPFKLEVRKNSPSLSSRYANDEQFSHWGFRPNGTTMKQRSNTFEIVQGVDLKSWKWTLVGKVISVSRHDLKHPSWKDSMDIAFSNGNSAASWFSWLGVYASRKAVTAFPDPPASVVTLRKKNSHSKMRTSADGISYKRPTTDDKGWMTIMGGHSQSAQLYASQLTYVSTTQYGRLPFCKVYRSGDTVVHERFIRADSWEPTVSRRYRFDNTNQARTWYDLWKNYAMDNIGDTDPTQVELVTKYACEIKQNNDKPILATKVWPDVNLQEWGSPKFKTNSSFSTTFTWIYQDNKITVRAGIDSLPDWFESLEIEFHNMQPASAWFTHLTGHETETEKRELPPLRNIKTDITSYPASAPPNTENVTVTNTRVCWIQKAGDSVETRAATSDKWIAVFSKSYKNLSDNTSHMSVVGSSVLPIIRIWLNKDTIHLDRKHSVDKTKGGVSRRYKFDSNVEAQKWYDIWREYLVKVTSATPK